MTSCTTGDGAPKSHALRSRCARRWRRLRRACSVISGSGEGGSRSPDKWGATGETLKKKKKNHQSCHDNSVRGHVKGRSKSSSFPPGRPPRLPGAPWRPRGPLRLQRQQRPVKVPGAHGRRLRQEWRGAQRRRHGCWLAERDPLSHILGSFTVQQKCVYRDYVSVTVWVSSM